MNKIELFKDYNAVIPFQVTNDIYKSFQLCSGDMNPLHTDLKFAKQKGFNNCVMYGNILNGFVSYAVGMKLPTSDVMIQTQNILFKSPVFMNDKLEMTIETDEIHDSVNVVILKFKFVNELKKIVAKGHVQIGVFEK